MKDVKILKPTGLFTNYIYKAIPLAFDESMSYYECLCGLLDYLKNTVVETVNNNADAIIELQEFVSHYFDNLDVQNEINNKLDKMAQDGTLYLMIKRFTEPIIEEQDRKINNQNAKIIDIENTVNSVASGSPKGVYPRVEDLKNDNPSTGVYIVTENGHIYSWTKNQSENPIDLGLYQSTGIGDNTITLANLKDEVINDRYKHSVENYNVLNPFKFLENKAILNNDGTISTNNNFYLTNEIILPAGQVLTMYNSNDFKDDTGSRIFCYKIGVYSLDGKFIKTVNTIDTYTNDNGEDVKIIIQYSKASFAYSRRFELMSFIHDENDNFTRCFIPYNELNNDNIYTNIKEFDLNVDLQKRINGFPEIKFESGTILSTGITHASPSRIRTKNYNWYKKGCKIEILDNNVSVDILRYDKDFNFISSTGWLNQSYVFPDDYYARICLKYNDDRDIEDKDLLISKFKFISNENNLYDVLNKYGILLYNTSNKIRYYGEKIELEKNAYFERQDFNTFGQDSANYNNLIFSFDNTGRFIVYDIDTGKSTGTFELDKYDTIKPHCNTCFFGTEKYNENDEFPLLYVNAYNTVGLPRGTCYAHRIIHNIIENTYSTQLVQTITLDFCYNNIWTVQGDIRFYGNFIMDTDNHKLYVYTMRDNKTRFFKFEMPTLQDGQNITLSQSDIIEYFDTPYEFLIQGALYLNGKIYSLNGNNNAQAYTSKLSVIDLERKEEITTIPLSNLMAEPESIIFYNNIYIGQSKFYKFNF